MNSAHRVATRKVDGAWRVEVTELEDGVATTEHLHRHPFPTRKLARELETNVRDHLDGGLHLNLALWSSVELADAVA